MHGIKPTIKAYQLSMPKHDIQP